LTPPGQDSTNHPQKMPLKPSQRVFASHSGRRPAFVEQGRGFSTKNLRHMVRFAEAFPDVEIVSTLSRQLAWSHFLEIIYIKDNLKRDFYAEMCRLECWSVRTLRQLASSMLFERTALSRKPDALTQQKLAALRESDLLTPALVLKDPYVLDFLGLQDRYLEKNLEDAILLELENFLLELGAGFTFVARQKRLQIALKVRAFREYEKTGRRVTETEIIIAALNAYLGVTG
jgi:predicted nuclease of restriction endonuclease-like (RecB) superfamily